jgi:hypothetical protein
VSHSTFVQNSAGGPGGSGQSSGAGYGGAIDAAYSNAPAGLTVSDSTFYGNTAGGPAGTGPQSGAGFGGAIYTSATNVTLQSDTIDGNSVGSSPSSSGSAIYGSVHMSAQATIISGNTGAPNCDAHATVSTYSLEGPTAADTSCGFDLASANPMLGQLTDNGGPTLTQALAVNSPAVAVVPQASCPTTTDQRGLPRPPPGQSKCDVGAFELQNVTAPPTCTVTAIRRAGQGGYGGAYDQEDVTVQAPGGLASISNVVITNGSFAIPGFAPGTTASVVVTATKSTQGQLTYWHFDVTDNAGRIVHCG